MADIIPLENIERRIVLIRGEKVMVDTDLAVMYGVSTKVLNQAVKRNFDAIRQLMAPPEKKRRKIGFQGKKE